jgi:tetratricopeptide (TPR) repeat protein
MRTLVWALGGALALAAGSASAATDKDRQDCDARDPERNVAGCTRIVEDTHEGAAMRGAAYVARGLAWQSKGDSDRALADFNAAIKLNPKDALAYNNRGMLWRERGDSDRAIADFTTAIAIDPMPRTDQAFTRRGKTTVAKPGVNIYENRALTLLEKSDFDGAIADFDQAIRRDPNAAESYNGRGAALRAKGEFDRAVDDFSYAIKLDGSNLGAYYNRGLVEAADGKLDASIADFTTALRLDPDFVDGYEARAEAFLSKTDPNHAIADLDEAIRRDPKRARDYYLRGSIRYDQYMGFLGDGWIEKDDLERAIADFGEAIGLDDRSAEVHYARGLAENTNGQSDLAAHDFAEAVRIEPENRQFAEALKGVTPERKSMR